MFNNNSELIISIQHGFVAKGSFGSIHIHLEVLGEKVDIVATKKFEKKTHYLNEKRINNAILRRVKPESIQFFALMRSFNDTALTIDMIYVNSVTVYDFCASFFKSNNKYSVNFINFIINGFISSVNALHELKIIHMDIKPNNLLIDERMQFKIIDFGLASLEGEVTAGYFGSRPKYIAPELDNNCHAKRELDFYSIGASIMILVERSYLLNLILPNGHLPYHLLLQTLSQNIGINDEKELKHYDQIVNFLKSCLNVQPKVRSLETGKVTQNKCVLPEFITSLSTIFKKELVTNYEDMKKMDRRIRTLHEEKQKLKQNIINVANEKQQLLAQEQETKEQNQFLKIEIEEMKKHNEKNQLEHKLEKEALLNKIKALEEKLEELHICEERAARMEVGEDDVLPVEYNDQDIESGQQDMSMFSNDGMLCDGPSEIDPLELCTATFSSNNTETENNVDSALPVIHDE